VETLAKIAPGKETTMPILDNENQVSVLVEGLDHAEGIAWGMDGYAYAGGEAGQLYRIDVDRGVLTQFADTGGFILGLALDAVGNIYACDIGNKCVQKITPGGMVTVYSSGPPGEPFITPNYPTFDARGNLYVADSGDWKADNGRIVKIAPGGEATVWDRGLSQFPNGLCMGPKGEYLYAVMSLGPPRIARVKIDTDGNAGITETVVVLPDTVPDGVAFDTDGNLYVSTYRPDRIYRMSPARELETLAEDPEGTLMASPTNIAFCGRERDILLSTNLGRWHITRYEAGATGMALEYPELRG
jgi:gluconolactonase